MSDLLFYIQDVATGLYAAPTSAAERFTPRPELAASYGVREAMQRAEELMAATRGDFRLIAIDSFDFILA